MSSELVPVSNATDGVLVADDRTGELWRVSDAPTDVLAAALRSIEMRLWELYEFKRALGWEVIARMDKSASWTLRAEGVEITAPSPSAGRDTWDAEKLIGLLDELVTEGVITREAQLAAVQQRTEYKPLVRGINALLKIDGVAERIAPARVAAVEGKPRSVKVSPNRGAS